MGNKYTNWDKFRERIDNSLDVRSLSKTDAKITESVECLTKIIQSTPAWMRFLKTKDFQKKNS